MATAVLMPNVGITVESCVLTEWHKQVGQPVQAGDLLFSYETDKSTLEERAPCDGVLLAHFFEEGDDIPVMTAVCAIGAAGEDVSGLAPQKAIQVAQTQVLPVQAAPLAPLPQMPAQAAPLAQAVQGGHLAVSPRARILAEKNAVNLRVIPPTGPENRIVERDVYAAMARGNAATAAAAQQYEGGTGTGLGGRFCVADIAQQSALPQAVTEDYTDEKMSTIRRTIAKQMLASLQNTAQLTHTLSFDATQLLALRKQYKERGSTVSINDLIVFVLAQTLKKPEHRALNAHLLPGDMLRTFEGVHLGVAVDTERGLFVPTLFHADTLSPEEISAQVRELADICRKGEAKPEHLAGGTFTLSNLGSFGIESFTPILNTPQTGILGVNTITTQVKVENGVLKPYQAMALSLTYDHRAVDGAPASRFLAELKQNAESLQTFLTEYGI